MRAIVALAILLATAMPAYSYQSDQQNKSTEKKVLRNADFQRSTSPNTINNVELQTQPNENAITNEDLELEETEHKGKDLTDYSRRSRVTRPRRVDPNTTTLRNVSLNKRQISNSEKSLLNRKMVLETRIANLEAELNELQQRVLQNRPVRTNKIGDPYFVDPDLRKKVNSLKQQLQKAETEYQLIVDKLDQSY